MIDVRVAPGNTKLGVLCYSWSIPAGFTCPGETFVCAGSCYAKRGHFRQGNVRQQHQRNYEKSRDAAFPTAMIGALRFQCVRYLRIHTAGDFYDEVYTDKWYDIMSRMPHVVAWAYTRSWRDSAIFPALTRLASLPNFRMWFSTDFESGPAPDVPGVRTAYMAVTQQEAATAPSDSDLVFRDHHLRKQVMKYTDTGRLVCPAENGTYGILPQTCTRCQLCFTDRTIPSREGNHGFGADPQTRRNDSDRRWHHRHDQRNRKRKGKALLRGAGRSVGNAARVSRGKPAPGPGARSHPGRGAGVGGKSR